jgi:spermidine synthase
VREIAAFELVPEVIESARRAFRGANLGVLDDPRVRVFLDDARTRLRVSPGAFDVIVGDLVVPWRRGEAALYTRESFASARRALAPGGIFCQWLPLFQLSRSQFDSIAATFLDLFPETLLWRGDFRAGEPAVALVGLTSGAPLDPAAIDERSRRLALRPDPANPYLTDPAGLWLYLAGSLSPADAAFRAAPRSLDDHPIVELTSPVTQFAGGGRGGSAFVREPLRLYFETLLDRPIAATPLERLEADQLRWRSAGLDIWTASLLDLQGRRAEADALGLGALARLPQALQRAVRGEAPTP